MGKKSRLLHATAAELDFMKKEIYWHQILHIFLRKNSKIESIRILMERCERKRSLWKWPFFTTDHTCLIVRDWSQIIKLKMMPIYESQNVKQYISLWNNTSWEYLRARDWLMTWIMERLASRPTVWRCQMVFADVLSQIVFLLLLRMRI